MRITGRRTIIEMSKPAYTLAEIEQAIARATCPIACRYLEAERNRRIGSKNNGRPVQYQDSPRHAADRERKAAKRRGK